MQVATTYATPAFSGRYGSELYDVWPPSILALCAWSSSGNSKHARASVPAPQHQFINRRLPWSGSISATASAISTGHTTLANIRNVATNSDEAGPSG